MKSSGEGHVVRFAVDAEFLSAYPVQQVGARTHRERWIPAEELAAFNDAIVGPVELIASDPGTDVGDSPERVVP